jgi:hypothetical protein
VPRRVRMPGADELFGRGPVLMGSTARLRAVPDPVEDEEEPDEPAPPPLREAPAPRNPPAPRLPAGRAPGRASGRERHDEKITVYVSPEELVGLEQARITLRAGHGLAVDRGRIVREAVNLVLADLSEHGEDSSLVRVLRSGEMDYLKER